MVGHVSIQYPYTEKELTMHIDTAQPIHSVHAVQPLSPVHPLGKRARVLLTSVFGPYARDDAFGSRAINPMELYHNQVTRVQGPFSLRMFHRSFGLMFIQANLNAPCTLLDFPGLDRFIAEIRDNRYDVVGISAIIPNIGKVKKMCELIREHAPNCAIVVGGHVANAPDIENRIDADHIVKGDGVAWFRRYLKEDDAAPIRHPRSLSGFNTRILGHTEKQTAKDTAGILIPSVGCPVGCNFCSTSALFGGKGHFVNFYETGDDLFRVMADLETDLGVSAFSSWTRISSSTGSGPSGCWTSWRQTTSRGPSMCSVPPGSSNPTPWINSSAWAFPGSGWGWRARAAPTAN